MAEARPFKQAVRPTFEEDQSRRLRRVDHLLIPRGGENADDFLTRFTEEIDPAFDNERAKISALRYKQ
jgi:hypothetical protein